MVKVGDKVVRTPKTFGTLLKRGSMEMVHKPLKGVVIFVHSKGRFHTVEFTNMFGGKLKESFDGVD